MGAHSVTAVFCPGPGWAGLGWAGLGWAGWAGLAGLGWVAGRYVEVVRILTSAQQPGQCWRSPGLRTVAVTNHLQHTRLLGSAQLPKIHFKLFII